MTKPTATDRRVERTARLTWVPLKLMRVPPLGQRKFKQSWADHLAVHMDLEQLGTPTVNKRGGLFYLLDGQHRVSAYKQWIGEGWESQQLHCWTYEGLTESEEAETFLKQNDILPVSAFDRFDKGFNANRPEEAEIAAVVMKAGLTIAQSKAEGAIGAVGTLRRVYRRDGAAVSEPCARHHPRRLRQPRFRGGSHRRREPALLAVQRRARAPRTPSPVSPPPRADWPG